MKRALVLLVAVAVLFGGCSGQQHAIRVAPKAELKRITQLDINTNRPVKSWNARADTIRQHVTPPVGIRFTDADTGQEVRFDGTYKIESYRNPSAPDTSNQPKPKSSPKKSKTSGVPNEE